MQPCPAGDSSSPLTLAIVVLISLALLGAILWGVSEWTSKGGAGRIVLATLGGLVLCGVLVNTFVGPLVDQALLGAGGREATATVLRQYATGHRDATMAISYSFRAELLDGTRCDVLREDEVLLEFDRVQRASGDSVAVRYLPGQPHIARVVPPPGAAVGHFAFGLVYMLLVPGLLAVGRLLGDEPPKMGQHRPRRRGRWAGRR